ncbi:MAG: helix-turn-helix transcriptional regulator [Candidatus Acidiferrales bacterium]
MTSTRSLGKQVKEFRLYKLAVPMTQRQFAAAVGISHVTVVRVERGDKVTSMTRAKIERFLKSQPTVASAA